MTGVILKVLAWIFGTWFCWVTITVCYDFAFNQPFSFTGLFVFFICFAYSVIYITLAGALIYTALGDL